jgi:FtsP/CotA-like multicopper oxidase with cupredoxin domain
VKAFSRRDLLCAAFGLAAGAPVAAVEQTYHSITPQHTMTGVGASPAVDPESLARALQRSSAGLNGFDPLATLTAFDSGQVSRLPGGRTLREYRVVAQDRSLEVAPGISYPAWTYNGTVPGPTLRATEGDRVRIHFENRSISEHTMHFHGIHSAAMDGVDEIVRPGGSFVYELDAEPYGLQLYHCHVPPVDLHMSRGLYGAFIIDPPRPRPPAKELVLVIAGWDLDFDGRNELYTLNGAANLYRDRPIPLKVGEPVRLYLVNALEHEPVSSFHIHANFFNVLRRTPEGERPDLADIVTLCQADRAILELSYRLPGHYMFHPHQNAFAERGAMGCFHVG